MANKKPTANDWQNFSIKKDIERTNKLIKNAISTSTTIIWEFVLAIFTVLVDRLFDVVNDWFYWVVFGLMLVPIIVRFIRWFWRVLRNKSISVNTKSEREFIDTFDNEVCYYVMMSDSFLDLLIGEETADVNRKVFYYAETKFYFNKAVSKLFEMVYKIDKIFSDDVKLICQERKVSIARLENLLDLLTDIRPKLQELSLQIDCKQKKQLSLDEIYCQRLEQFITAAQRKLHIDVERYRV